MGSVCTVTHILICGFLLHARHVALSHHATVYPVYTLQYLPSDLSIPSLQPHTQPTRKERNCRSFVCVIEVAAMYERHVQRAPLDMFVSSIGDKIKGITRRQIWPLINTQSYFCIDTCAGPLLLHVKATVTESRPERPPLLLLALETNPITHHN